jgi:hypothetical protein
LTLCFATAVPTGSHTAELRLGTVEDLSMVLYGISEVLSGDEVASWQETTAKYQEEFYLNAVNSPVQDFGASITITTITLPDPSRNRRGLRNLQQQEDFITVLYQQSMTYRMADDTPQNAEDPVFIATVPFDPENGREAYVGMLQMSGTGILVDITSTSTVTADATLSPTVAPAAPTPIREDDELPLSLAAIIGIGVGGGFFCLGVTFYLCSRSPDNEGMGANAAPPIVKIKPGSDGVSTLPPPPLSGRGANGDGDQRYEDLAMEKSRGRPVRAKSSTPVAIHTQNVSPTSNEGYNDKSESAEDLPVGVPRPPATKDVEVGRRGVCENDHDASFVQANYGDLAMEKSRGRPVRAKSSKPIDVLNNHNHDEASVEAYC